MAATAFVVGFFTAFGWWSAGKITTVIDGRSPIAIIQQEKEKGN